MTSSGHTAYVDLYNNDNSTSINELTTTNTTITRRTKFGTHHAHVQ